MSILLTKKDENKALLSLSVFSFSQPVVAPRSAFAEIRKQTIPVLPGKCFQMYQMKGTI